MRALLKNIFRYSFKNKYSFFSLFLMFFICLFLLITLGLFVSNLSRKYNELLATTNPHNVLINENFDDNIEGDISRAEFELQILKEFSNDPNIDTTVPTDETPQQKLYRLNSEIYNIQHSNKNIDLRLRNFNSIDLNGLNNEKFKMVKYLSTYSIDKLFIYEGTGLPKNASGQQTVPTGLDFKRILDLALDVTNTSQENIEARQMVVFFISKADWTSSDQSKFESASKELLNAVKTDPTIDPATYTGSATYNEIIKPFFELNNPNFKIDNKIFKLIFTKSDALGDSVATYHDFTSYTSIVSPIYLQNNHKKVFPYSKFLEFSKVDKTDLSNSPSQQQFRKWFDKIDNSYKIYIQNIPYLIVGSGLSPDFTYPIVSFENVVVDYNKSAILYSNNSGFERTKNSWPTAPQENLIVANYTGNLPFAHMLTKINAIGKQYMPNFPPSINIAYAAGDQSNIYTPSPIRVTFIEGIIKAINTVSIVLIIFLVLISMFVTTILLQKFIKENIKSLYIIIANGFNKYKAILAISLVTIIPTFCAAVLGFIAAYFAQVPTINLFGAYWSIPILPSGFGTVYIVIIAFIALFAFNTILIFFLAMIALRKPVSSGINTDGIKLGWLARQVKKPFKWTGIVSRFRISIAFSSVSKLLFLSLISSLSMSSIIFISSTYKMFDKTIDPTIKTNSADFAINLTTPTWQGGQYYGVDFNKIGQEYTGWIKDSTTSYPVDGIVNNSQYKTPGDSYQKYYENPPKGIASGLNANPSLLPNVATPLFKTWSQLHYPQTSDLSSSRTKLNYLFNKTENQFLLDVYLGGNIIPSNPWVDIIDKMIPVNQSNTSIEKTNNLITNVLNDFQVLDKTVASYQFNGTLNNKLVATTSEFGPTATSTIAYFYITNNPNFRNDGKTNYPIVYLDDSNDETLNIKNIYQSYQDWKVNPAPLSDTDPITLQVSNYFTNLPMRAKNNFSEVIENPRNRDALLVHLSANLLDGSVKYTTYSSVFKYLFDVKPYDPNKPVTPPSNGMFTEAPTIGKQLMVYEDTLNHRQVLINKQSPNLFKGLGDIGMSASPMFTNFADHVFSDSYYQNDIYKISYNSVPLNLSLGDEPYCYINYKLDETSSGVNSSYKHNNLFPIIGLYSGTKKVNLTNADTDEPITQEWLIAKQKELEIDKIYPVVINLFAAKQYNLNVNDVISGVATNRTDRYLVDKNKVLPEVKFKVVAINDTRKDPEFYTTMDAAQQILGLATAMDYKYVRTLSSNPDVDPSKQIVPINDLNNRYNNFGGFNGIYTSDPNLQILSSGISLYSPSGTYLSIDTFKDDPNLIKIFDGILSQKGYTPSDLNYLGVALGLNTPEKVAELRSRYNLTTDKNKFVLDMIHHLNTIYDGYVYFSIPEKPDALASSRAVFDKIANTINAIEIIVVSLIIILSILILLITSWVIIADLMKVILLLKTQGFSDLENALNIFSVFIPTWILSTLVTVPLIIFALKAFKEFAFASLGVLLNINISWFAFFIGSISLAVLFIIIIGFVTLFLKKTNVVDSLRWN